MSCALLVAHKRVTVDSLLGPVKSKFKDVKGLQIGAVRSTNSLFLREYELQRHFLHRSVMLIDSLIPVTRLITSNAWFTIFEREPFTFFKKNTAGKIAKESSVAMLWCEGASSLQYIKLGIYCLGNSVIEFQFITLRAVVLLSRP